MPETEGSTVPNQPLNMINLEWSQPIPLIPILMLFLHLLSVFHPVILQQVFTPEFRMHSTHHCLLYLTTLGVLGELYH